ncbi:MAG: GGDEF domain-containing protein, partial [Anaerolineales bacterium]
LTAELSLEKVLNRLFDLLARVVEYDSVSVFLLQDDDRMEPVAARGGGDVEQIRHSMREVHRPESQRGFWPTDRALIVADTRDHSHWHFYPGTEQVRSWVGAPLLVRGESIGVLNVNSHTPNAYAPQTSELVMAFANQAAVAIQNARLSDRLLELARVDSLTGLINRRHSFEIAEQEFQRARRYKRPLAVIMLDLDHFKRVNDTHGHAVGDEVLQAVAQRCRQNLREIDTLGRYGGEEFLVVMPEVELAHARQAAERLRSCVAGAPLETEIGPVALTISLGVAVLTAAHADLPPLVKAADAALYAAKEGGRNRVVVAGEGSTPEW